MNLKKLISSRGCAFTHTNRDGVMRWFFGARFDDDDKAPSRYSKAWIRIDCATLGLNLAPADESRAYLINFWQYRHVLDAPNQRSLTQRTPCLGSFSRQHQENTRSLQTLRPHFSDENNT